MTNLLNNFHVLVIDDNADNLWIVEHLLRYEAGLAAITVTSKTSGRALFQWLGHTPASPIDVVLLDLQIADEDGYSVLQSMRAHPALHRARVIALTANITHADVQRCRSAGFDGFIGKPIMFDQFPSQIRRILAGEIVWEPL